MGAGIAASPQCAERRICRCSIYLGPALTNEFVTPLLDPGSPAQASHSILQLPLGGARPICRPACPKAPWSSDPTGLLEPKSLRKPPDVPRPFLGKPLSRPALLTSVPKNRGSRVARQEDFLFRRLLPAGLNRNPKISLTACRRRSDLRSCRFRQPLRVFVRGRNRRPDHLKTMHLAPESGKRNLQHAACG